MTEFTTEFQTKSAYDSLNILNGSDLHVRYPTWACDFGYRIIYQPTSESRAFSENKWYLLIEEMLYKHFFHDSFLVARKIETIVNVPVGYDWAYDPHGTVFYIRNKNDAVALRLVIP
jgi:hypothetical protein